LDCVGLSLGGDEGDRTPGLGIANAALSQLSYIPKRLENMRKHILLFVSSVKKLLTSNAVKYKN
jgi:hypothetical protein